MLTSPALIPACLIFIPCLSALHPAGGSVLPHRNMAGECSSGNLALRGGDHDCVGLSWGRDKNGFPVLLEGNHDRESAERQHHHNAVVVKLSHAMKDRWAARDTKDGGQVALNRGSKSGNQVHDSGYKKGARSMDMSELNHVLEVDTTQMTASAEPLVTMDELVAATLKHGLLPKVVPEFRHITVGGAIMGAALESSSHRHGQFLDICSSATVLLGDGTVLACSSSKHADLFHALSGSYGSLAVLLLAQIQLQPAGPFVKVRYSLASGSQGAISELRSKCAPKPGSASEPAPEFVEAMQLPPQGAAPLSTLVMCADFVPAAEEGLPVRRFHRHWGLWYYEHASRIARRLQRGGGGASASAEIVPTLDYLFRYDYGAFWMARPLQPWSRHTRWTPVLPGMFLVSSPLLLVRLLAGWLFATKRLFSFLKKAPPRVIAEKMIIMDAYMPADNAGALIEFVREAIPISTPLWLCPLAGASSPQLLSPHGHCSGLMVNVGIYGRVCDGRGREYSAALERRIAELGGRKMLYSQNFYARDEFWGTAGLPWSKVMPRERDYARLRDKYKSEGVLASLFDKVCEAARPPKPETIWSKIGHFIARLML